MLVGGHNGPTQEEGGGDLSDASYVFLKNHPRSHKSLWERAVASGAHGDAVVTLLSSGGRPESSAVCVPPGNPSLQPPSC